MRRWKIYFSFLTFWTDKRFCHILAWKFLLIQTRAGNRFPHESRHLPPAPCWKLALRGAMEVHCCVEPARGSLIKLSPRSWNVISSFVIQARIICLHFASDGLLDNNGLGPNDAGGHVHGGGITEITNGNLKKKSSDPSHLEIGNHPENLFPVNLPFRLYFYRTSPCTVRCWCVAGALLNILFPLSTFLPPSPPVFLYSYHW